MNDDDGNFIVYKGYCLQPTCFTLSEAQELLGERKAQSSGRRSGKVFKRLHQSFYKTNKRRASRSPRRASTRRSIQGSFCTEPPGSSLAFYQDQSSFDFDQSSSVLRNEPQQSHRNILHRNSHKRRKTPPTDGAEAEEKVPTISFASDPMAMLSFLKQQLQQETPLPANVVKLAIQNLQKTVVAMHGHVQAPIFQEADKMADVIWSTFLQHLKRQATGGEVVESILIALTTLCSLSHEYVQVVGASEKAIPCLVSAIAKYGESQKLQTLSFDLVEHLTGSDVGTVALEGDTDSEKDRQVLIEMLASRLDCCSDDDISPEELDCAYAAVRSLANLTRRNADLLAQVIESLKYTGGGTDLLEMLRGNEPSPDQETSVAIVSLLHNLSSADYCFVETAESIVETMILVMSRSDSLALHHHGLGLLATLTEERYTLQTAGTIKDCVLVVCESIRKHSRAQELGVRVLLNVLSEELRDCISGVDRICLASAVVKLVSQSVWEKAHRSEGCQLLGLLLDWDAETRSIVNTKGGAKYVVRAFRNVVANKHSNSDDDAKLHVVSVLEKLSSQPNMLAPNAAIAILLDLQRALKTTEGCPSLQLSLLRIAMNLLPRILSPGSLSATEPIMKEEMSISVIECFLSRTGASFPASVIHEALELLSLFYRDNHFRGSFAQSSILHIGSSQAAIVTHTRAEFEAILRTVSIYSAEIDVQKASLGALINFFAPCLEADSKRIHNEVVEAASESIEAVVDAMVQNFTSSEIQVVALKFFQVLIFLANSRTLYLAGQEVVDNAIDAAEYFEDDENLQVTVCCTIAEIQRCGEDLEILSSTAIMRMLMRMLEHATEPVVVQSSELLSSLLRKRFAASEHLLEVEDVAAKLVRCMEKHAQSAQIQEHICNVMGQVISLQDHLFAQEVVRAGGLREFSNLLRRFPDSSFLVESALRALTGTLTASGRNELQTHRLSICHAVVNAMQDNAESLEVQLAAMDAIHCLCVREDSFKNLLSASIPAVVQAMNNHSESVNLLTRCCSVIRMVSTFCEDRKEMFIECQPAQSILNALLTHPRSVELLKEGMSTLKDLAAEPWCRELLSRKDAEAAIVSILQHNSFNPDVLACAFAALNNIVVDATTRSVAPMKETVLHACIKALDTFPADTAIGKNACLLLKSYSYDQDSLALMRAFSDTLVPLLYDMSESCPPETSGRAHYILEKL
jgi:hypothetical protein